MTSSLIEKNEAPKIKVKKGPFVLYRQTLKCPHLGYLCFFYLGYLCYCSVTVFRTKLKCRSCFDDTVKTLWGDRVHMCVSVHVIKAVCAVRSCTGVRGGGQEAQTFIKSQHHHLPGVLGVPSANTFTIFLTESFLYC